MPVPSSRLALAKPVTADDFSTTGLADNWQKVDNHPGTYLCTLATRPTWGSAHEGMLIYETDTDLYWRWNGSSFEREFPRGRLANTVTRTTPLIDTSGSFVDIAQLADVAVPAGNRSIQITLNWYDATGDDAELELRRESTTLITRRISVGGTLVFVDLPGSGGGTFDYTARWRTLSAASTLVCDTGGKQFSMGVVEL